VLHGSTVTVTLLRPTFITGPRDPTTAPGFRAHAALSLGPEPTWQFVREDDVAAAVELALRIDLPGAYNVVPDDSITASEAFRLLGVKRVPWVPMALARVVTYVRWRWRGDRTHPSWLPVINADVTFDNSRLKAAGWTPRYTSAGALRSAANAPPTMLRR
jgi:nucleoside-diphosphate-sugar epimerase